MKKYTSKSCNFTKERTNLISVETLYAAIELKQGKTWINLQFFQVF